MSVKREEGYFIGYCSKCGADHDNVKIKIKKSKLSLVSDYFEICYLCLECGEYWSKKYIVEEVEEYD